MTIKSDIRAKVIELAETGKGRNKIAHELSLAQGSGSSILKKWRESKSKSVATESTDQPSTVDEITQAALSNDQDHKISINEPIESGQDSHSQPSLSALIGMNNTGSPSSKVHSEILDGVGHKPL